MAAIPPKPRGTAYVESLEEWAQGAPEENLFVYGGRGQSFTVTTEGVVGEPGGSKGFSVVELDSSSDDDLLIEGSSSSRCRRCRCCCYLTTAACAALGAGDDCPELQVLRWFRDEVLLRDREGALDVERYYATAPGLVAAIDASPNPRSLYLEIFHGTIRPAVAAILGGRHDEAYRRYRAMVRSLEERLGARRAR